MNRRNFIIQSCAACLAAGALSTIVSSCNTSKYITGKLIKDGLTIHKNSFKTSRNGKAGFLTALVIRNETLKYPLYVYRFTDTEYVALWMQCTHQGAELQAFGDSLQCPAHGSEFDKRGNVTSGPADRNLKKFPVTVQDDELFIDLRKTV